MAIGSCLLGSGLTGGPDCSITIDCSALMADLVTRISSGENVDAILADLYYGLEAEISEFLDRLFENVLFTLEVTMSQTDTIRLNSSPEPTTLPPPN